MKKLILLIVPPMLLTGFLAHSQPLDVESFCNLETPQSVRVFDWADWKTTHISDDSLILEPLHWDASRSIFRGYDVGDTFAQPQDASQRWSISFVQDNGSDQTISVYQSTSTPDTDYLYVFPTKKPTADTAGKHYGLHPCRAFETDASVVSNWLTRVQAETPLRPIPPQPVDDLREFVPTR